jgi:hypothetical protein
VIVHQDRLSSDAAARWQRADLTAVGLKKIAAFGADVIDAVPSADPPASLRVTLAVPDRLSIDARLTLGLLADGIEHRPCRHPSPMGRTEAVVESEEARTGKVFKSGSWSCLWRSPPKRRY